MRRVVGQNGYCGQILQVHFGLGDASSADSIIIEWPSGIQQVLIDQNSNQRLIIIEDTTTTSVEEGNSLIDDYKLLQNYPNPFNPVTQIDFILKEGSEIKLSVFNHLGELIMNLYEGYKDAGRHSIEFNRVDLSSGIYLYKLKAADFIQTKKMLLLK